MRRRGCHEARSNGQRAVKTEVADYDVFTELRSLTSLAQDPKREGEREGTEKIHPRSDERLGTTGSECVSKADAPATRKHVTSRAPLRQGTGMATVGHSSYRGGKTNYAKCIGALAFAITADALVHRAT